MYIYVYIYIYIYIQIYIYTQGKLVPHTVNIDIISGVTTGVCLWVIAMHGIEDARTLISPLLNSIDAAPISDNLEESGCWWEVLSTNSLHMHRRTSLYPLLLFPSRLSSPIFASLFSDSLVSSLKIASLTISTASLPFSPLLL